MTRRPAALALALLLGAAPAALAQKGVPPTAVVVGGRPMMSDRDMIENLALSADHTVLLELLRDAGLAEGMQAHGPFTLFAPTNAAFAALPPGTLDSLRRPENKAALVNLLSVHVVSGNYSSARLHLLLRNGKGQAELDTVNEEKLTVGTNGPTNLVVHGPKGDPADVTLYDAKQANGVLFVIDRVLQPD